MSDKVASKTWKMELVVKVIYVIFYPTLTTHTVYCEELTATASSSYFMNQ